MSHFVLCWPLKASPFSLKRHHGWLLDTTLVLLLARMEAAKEPLANQSPLHRGSVLNTILVGPWSQWCSFCLEHIVTGSTHTSSQSLYSAMLLLCPDKVVHAVLCLVLGCPGLGFKRGRELLESPTESTKVLRNLEHLSEEECLRDLGIFSPEETEIWGSFQCI